jgi:hypothetical protein
MKERMDVILLLEGSALAGFLPSTVVQGRSTDARHGTGQTGCSKHGMAEQQVARPAIGSERGVASSRPVSAAVGPDLAAEAVTGRISKKGSP